MSTTTAITNQSVVRLCTCGCGEHVAKRTNYRPGHDARHASAVARQMVIDGGWTAEQLRVLPSPALIRKAMTQFERLSAAPVAKPSKSVKATVASVQPVKVGRWTYPAMRDNAGTLLRNTKRDGSGEWVAA